jgi:hypothetical protein
MKGSNRFKNDPFLLNLAKKTIIQYNKGFRKCNKPSTIISTCEDLVHAYYTAFKYLRKYNNVIILEDDVLVINENPLIYDKIDKFINTQDFDILTFASQGRFSKYNEDFFSISSFFGCTQAIIYSQKARTKLIKDISSSNFNRGHFDNKYIHYLDKKFTYKYPLIVQLFPETENRSNWTNNIFLSYYYKLRISLLQLDTRPDGWYLEYFICKNFKILILLLVLIIFLIIFSIILLRRN